MTLPNGLSILRMGLVPWFVIALLQGRHGQALVVFLLAALTDALDGFLARSLDQASSLGAYLDPIADKLLIVSAFVLLAWPGGPAPRIPLWISVLVIARDLLILLIAAVMFAALGHLDFPPTRLGKANTLCQVVAVGLVLVASMLPQVTLAARIALWLVAALTIGSSLQYLWRLDRLVAARSEADEASSGGLQS